MNEQEMEQYFEAFLEACPDDITITDLDGHFIRLSQSAIRMFGYDQAESLNGSHVTEFIFPSDRDRAKENLAKRIQGDISGPEEYKAVRADGSVFDIEVNAGFVKDKAGKPFQIVFIVRDITQRKIIERNALRNRILLEETGRIAKVGGWEFDVISLEQNWTEEVYMIHEVDLDFKPTVQNGIAFYTPEARPVIEEAVNNAIQRVEPFDLELSIVTGRGNLKWVRAKGRPMIENGVVKTIFGIFQDITDRKSTELALIESEDRFRAISEYSNSAICMVDENARITWGNEALVKLGGYPAEELYATESFLEFLAPESVDFVMNNFMLFLAGKEYAHNYSFYLKQKSGELRLCEKYMTDYTDKAGKRFLAISMLDITDRHNAQQELIKAKEKAEESDRLKTSFLGNRNH